MRKKKSSTANTRHVNRGIEVVVPPGTDDKGFAAAVAKVLMKPETTAASMIDTWHANTHDVNALVAELGRQVQAVNSGDLSRAEATLIAQAHALDCIFGTMARRATLQEYLPQWEAYMRMALKAQNQCRMTLETLATIKNPPVVFARQANINNGGQQQVNNTGTSAQAQDPRAHAAKAPAAQTGLLEASDGQWMDPRAAGATNGADPQLAPLGEIHRPVHG